MWEKKLVVVAVLALLGACSTPYNPTVTVHDSAPFPGIAAVIAENGAEPVDVVLVHGMCTHTAAWADTAIDTISGTVKANAVGKPVALAAQANGIEVVERSAPL